ncbi:Cyclin-L1-1 [Phytophthora citrophthora]|uniref:Cyclin-L1-1 n=1 Tax=Phytophthora citrophthora TaxID=4793 RepID=A0AAD9GU38_9STRA|nr:Cyclin-L1-1 [Phytophthora citrophthora]
MTNRPVHVHVVLPASSLSSSPSSQDGVTLDVERLHRSFGCELIQEAGVLLRLPQVVMATAQTLLQRFYYRKSLRQFDAFRVAVSCLFLAAKVEEKPKRIKDVVGVFYAMYRRRKWKRSTVSQQLVDLDGATFTQWRMWLIMVERQVLIDLGFSVYNVTEHPHKYVLYYVKVLDGSSNLAQQAWGYINDSMRADLCVRYKAQVIACAAIFLASRFQGVALPENPPWYALFDVEKSQLYTVSVAIMELYKQEKVQWLEPLTETNPFSVDDHPMEEKEQEQEKEPSSDDKVEKEISPQEPSSFDKSPHDLKSTPPETSERRSRWDDGQKTRRRGSRSPVSRSRRSRSGSREPRRELSNSRRRRSRSRSSGRSRGSRSRRRRSRSYSRSRSRSNDRCRRR